MLLVSYLRVLSGTTTEGRGGWCTLHVQGLALGRGRVARFARVVRASCLWGVPFTSKAVATRSGGNLSWTQTLVRRVDWVLVRWLWTVVGPAGCFLCYMR